MSVILMTTQFYKALILQGEILCWSLFGLGFWKCYGDSFPDLKILISFLFQEALIEFWGLNYDCDLTFEWCHAFDEV